MITAIKKHTEVEVSHYPECDLCKTQNIILPAHYDVKTSYGVWANVCEHHYKVYGRGLGLGKGQRFILKEGV